MPIPAITLWSSRHPLIAFLRFPNRFFRYSALHSGDNGSNPNLLIPLFFRLIIKNFPLRAVEEITCPVTALQNSLAPGYATASGRLTVIFSIVSPCICGSITFLFFLFQVIQALFAPLLFALAGAEHASDGCIAPFLADFLISL